VPIVVHHFGWELLVYAVLSLTVVRMAPVALVLRRTTLKLRASLFIGWFGPRGLASVVFALLAVEELGTGADTAVAVIATTVLASVLAHGFSARPLATRFGPGLAPAAADRAFPASSRMLAR